MRSAQTQSTAPTRSHRPRAITVFAAAFVAGAAAAVIVPHLPPMSIGYRHSSGEVFEDVGGALHTCSGDEDAKCSQQYRLIQTRADDHLYYLGFRVTCDYETVV